MQHIITDIMARLQSKVTTLQYIAQDWGQLSYYADHPPVKFPCALIDISQGQTSQTGKHGQEVLLTINITLAHLSQHTSTKAPADMRNRELAIYTLMQQIHQALHGYSGYRDYTPLIRTAFTRKLRDDGIRISTITFTTNWQDASAIPPLAGSVTLQV